ncbi:MAG: hypothetical protein U0234_20795 [Sandaracinus sp.]
MRKAIERGTVWMVGLLVVGGLGTGCSSNCGPGGGNDERGALGQSCSTSSACGGGLTCDTTDPLNGLCTTTCNSSEECIDRYGFGSFCIGAHRCVRECVSDDDCLPGTQCGPNRWCE